jgi:hypothetical protein
MLDDGTAPDLPEWTGSFFIPETENAELQRAIYNFQSSLSGAYWDLSTEWWLWNASPDVQAQFNTYFDELRAAKTYIGHQWIHASYRSFDRQSDTMAVVTVRETWEDWLYPFEIDPGDMEPLRDPINQRGPYTLDVTYTLEYTENQWQITRVVYTNEPPAWE